jgi:hypothetical protein
MGRYFGPQEEESKAAVNPHRGSASNGATRKRLRKQAEKKFPGRPMQWIGGILFFTDDNTRVPGVEEKPKFDKAIGLKAIGEREENKYSAAAAGGWSFRW